MIKWKKYTKEGLPNFAHSLFNSTNLAVADLPFYKNTVLLKVIFRDFKKVELRYLIYQNKELFPLNGLANSIHAINKRENLNLQEKDVLPYLYFFCRHIFHSGEPFLIIESVGEALINDLVFEPAERNRVVKQFSEPKLDGVGKDGRYLVKATVHYLKSIYLVSFEIAATGEVSMTNDHLIWQQISKSEIKLIEEEK